MKEKERVAKEMANQVMTLDLTSQVGVVKRGYSCDYLVSLNSGATLTCGTYLETSFSQT